VAIKKRKGKWSTGGLVSKVKGGQKSGAGISGSEFLTGKSIL
jgi:hypothetical protein